MREIMFDLFRVLWMTEDTWTFSHLGNKCFGKYEKWEFSMSAIEKNSVYRTLLIFMKPMKTWAAVCPKL